MGGVAVRPLRVAVLMGGPSEEREISLRSGEAVLAALDPVRFTALSVDVGADGRWLLGVREEEASGAEPGRELVRAARDLDVDVVLVALHGRFGEDGTVQGLLEAAGLPYTGSGVLASALAMDKERAKAVVRAAGLPVPRGSLVDRSAWRRDPRGILDTILRFPGLPAFVKPPGGGSSLGAGPAADGEELGSRLDALFATHGDRALVEERLTGREVTCAVLGNRGRPAEALPVVEIRTRAGTFFDFAAKYEPGGCEEICPAPLDPGETRRVREAAIAAHRALGCDGMSRSDFILVEGEPVFLETNTIPGMTDTSLCPRAAAAAGLPFGDLVERLVEMALERAVAPADGGAPRGGEASGGG